MPYVDEGDQPKRPGLPMGLPYVAGLAGAGVSVYLWGLFFSAMGNVWLAPLVTGAMTGGAIRLASKQRLPKIGLFAVMLTLVACIGGYAYRHMAVIQWNNTMTGAPIYPDFSNAMQYLANDMTAVLLSAMGAYIAFMLATLYPTTAHDASQNPPVA